MNERTKINIEVLQQLQSGELTKQGAAKYTGWGGMRHDMENPDVQQQLKTLMTPNEIKSALNSITSAYYTPLPIVQFTIRR